MCKADKAIFRLRVSEGACSHPTHSPGSLTKMPSHIHRHARGWKNCTAHPTFHMGGSHSPAFMCCVITLMKKIMKAGIKEVMKLEYSPEQGRHLWE